MAEAEVLIPLSGTVASVRYQNPENGYAVLRVSTPDGLVTCVGCFPAIQAGEDIDMEGKWVVHPSYGSQFTVERVRRREPTGSEAIFRYLASGALKNIGPARARQIVDKFGGNTLEIIENDPEQLTSIKGMSHRAAMEISNAYRHQTSLRRLMEFLEGYDIRPVVALRLHKCYGESSVEAVRDNPYILVGEPFGADFFEADAMALGMGFEGDCHQRVEAAILFELEHNLSNGHSFLPVDKLTNATSQLISVESDPIAEAFDVLIEAGDIIRETVAGVDACYLARLYEAESFVAARLAYMASAVPFRIRGIDGLVSEVEREQSVTYADMQRRAVELAAANRVLVLTGGPGTGKTTSVRGILAIFDKLGLKTLLCAPTGRAAKRMSELTGREASTIHRMLGVSIEDGRDMKFDHDSSDPLDADAVILDETSMVDITLMSALLSAMRPDCRLVLVGDADQLPSVGPGNLFSEIIRSGKVETVILTEIFRQARESNIVKNAHLINKGMIPELSEKTGDFFFIRRSGALRTAETVVDLVARRLPQNMGIDPSQIQVLSPTKRDNAGTVNLNRLLQEALNPSADDKKEKKFGDFTYREGDKVMQIRNNYDIIWQDRNGISSGCGVFNGDVGTIIRIDERAETVTVDFDDKLVTYLFTQLIELEPAYAMTVHKSQGSEYRAVVLALSSGNPRLLVRGVLYTAVTRARELLIIVGSEDAVPSMVNNDKRQRRYSGLRWRLTEALKD